MIFTKKTENRFINGGSCDKMGTVSYKAAFRLPGFLGRQAEANRDHKQENESKNLKRECPHGNTSICRKT